MSSLLYLDTARLGQVSPSAKRALTGALEFNQAFGAGAYFDELFISGAQSFKKASEFGGLELWPGIDSFSTSVKEKFFGSASGQIVFASRTTSLMGIAAKLLLARSSKVLVTDLNWHPFTEILNSSAAGSGGEIATVKIKGQVFDGRTTASEIAEKIASAFVSEQCNGIFLPAVCNLGVALPIVEIIDAIEERAEIRFSIVDAAQAVNHVALDKIGEAVDFTFGGTHKWLRSFEPMAMGYFAKPGSQTFIHDSIYRELKTNPFSDSLMRLTQLEAPQKSETVNLAPMFAVAGAMTDVEMHHKDVDQQNDLRAAVGMVAEHSGWKCMSLSSDLRSRILLLRNPRLQKAKAGIIRQSLIQLGIAVTDYPGGICRISLPDKIGEEQIEQLRHALAKVI